jgi:low affinity Fe/Cu permease
VILRQTAKSTTGQVNVNKHIKEDNAARSKAIGVKHKEIQSLKKEAKKLEKLKKMAMQVCVMASAYAYRPPL